MGTKATAVLLVCMLCLLANSKERSNFLNDPFEQVTSALKQCPEPQGPLITEEQAKAESHYRVERGTSCYQSGRCRLPNAYLYDSEIIPRVKRFLQQDDRFQSTSIWITGQRRWVTLEGCVTSKKLSEELENAVKNIDDVETVINEITVIPRENSGNTD